LNNGAAGVVTAATSTSLTVAFTTSPDEAGLLNAVVTSNSVSSGSAVQVATVIPEIESNTAILAANATTVLIFGYGFDTTTANNTVTFDNGAAGTVTAATATQLTVNLTTGPTEAGSLSTTVTTNSASSGSPVQVATVSPMVTSSTASLLANATSITIVGLGFDDTPANDTIAFNNGAIGTVTAATASSMTVTFTTTPTTMGNLTAIVTTNSLTSGSALQVATVRPVVTGSSANLAANAATMTIAGFGFDATTLGNNTVQFNNGAVGTVTAATATQLTVSISTNPNTAGSLTAIVTTNSKANGSAVQIASVTPVVTSSTSSLAANANTLTINGFGFDPTASRNTVVLNNSAVGTVTAATTTSLTLTFTTRPATAGSLTAIVTTNSLGSGSAVQIATVTPVVTSSSANLASNASTMTINGFGFDSVSANNSVTLNNGAVGTISAATTTSLTVTFSTKPAKAGVQTAIVATNTQTSGSAVQVAAVVPVVLANAGNILPATGTTLTIVGHGFDTTLANNTVAFNNRAVGTVSAATATTLTVTLSTGPSTAGSLTAIVTTNSINSGTAVQVAAIVPLVTNSCGNLAANAMTLTINGFGFDPIAVNNTVVFNDGAIGTVTTATANSLTMTLSTSPSTAGDLTAVVTTSSRSSGAAIRVATVIPVVTVSTTSLAANAATVVINGFGFGTTVGNNLVTFNNGAIGDVTSATAITVTFSTRPSTAGSLTAIVSTGGVNSAAAVQVGRVTPVITSSTASLAANATLLTINGFGFSSTASQNTVVFSNGAIGTVTTSTPTSLTVTISTRPTAVGNLTAVVTTSGFSSGTAVQVATVRPVVTLNTSDRAGNAATVVINGIGFSTTAANNTVVLNNSAVGTVTSATSTALTVTFSTKPAAVGILTAVITTDGLNSGAAIQVANVIPFVTSNVTNLAATANTVTIRGFAFNPVAASNTVVFNNGAVGTVTAATATSLTVTFSVKPATAGPLTAIVTSNTVVSGTAVQVADTTPVVTSRSTNLLITASTITITGFGFDLVASRNTVIFNNGAIGTVTAATATTLTITFMTKPVSTGSLTAIVTTNSKSSGSAVQVATVVLASCGHLNLHQRLQAI